MTAALVLPPLMVACLDDLLIRRRHRPAVTGSALGVLRGAAVLRRHRGSRHGRADRRRRRGTGRALRRALRTRRAGGPGPRRAGGAWPSAPVSPRCCSSTPPGSPWTGRPTSRDWSGPASRRGRGASRLSSLWHLTYGDAALLRLFSGYQGPALPDASYLGLGALVVVAVGLAVWHRDRRLWFFGALGVAVVVLSLGRQSYWTPWRVLARVPILENAVPGRLMAVVTLCAAVLVAVVVDRTRAAVEGAGWPATGRAGRARGGGGGGGADGRGRAGQRALHHPGRHVAGLVCRNGTPPAGGPGRAHLPPARRRGLRSGRGRPSTASSSPWPPAPVRAAWPGGPGPSGRARTCSPRALHRWRRRRPSGRPRWRPSAGRWAGGG